MAIDKIKTIVVEDDAVTQPKIAAGAITNTELNKTVITGLTELSSADVADADQLIIYDASADTLKKVTKARTTNLDFPVYTSVSPATSQTADGGNITFTITGSGFTAGTNARLISNTGQKLDFTTVTRTNTTTITGTIARSSLLVAQSPYDIQIINGEGLSVLGANQINIDEFPVFITASGSLGTPNEGTSVNILVEARDPDSSSAITFELQSGSLPAGLSLVNTSEDSCRITGTLSAVASTTVSNFVLRAFDTASNTASRAFSITATNVPVTTSFTSSGTFAVPSGVSVADVLVVAGGGGSGANHAGGGGAGGLVFFPCTPITPGGTIAITVGCGGAGGSASDDLDSGDNGQDSVFGASPSPGLHPSSSVLTAKGGGGGGTGTSGNATVGLSGGSGGGASGFGNASPTAGGSAIQPTQSGNSGAYGFGNAGGSGVRPNPNNNYSGGGGGAGAAGETGGQGGDGGIGKAYTISDGTTSVYYAGGGGGGRYASGYVQTQGGQGGGGVSNPGAAAGQANTGGGGGAPQQAGGKGIVIVRY